MTAKLRSSTGPSKNSNYRNSRPNELDTLDRFEVLRTVELETWTESRKPGHGVGHVSDVTSQPDHNEFSDGSYAPKDSAMVYAAPDSSQSSETIFHGVTKDSPGDRSPA